MTEGLNGIACRHTELSLSVNAPTDWANYYSTYFIGGNDLEIEGKFVWLDGTPFNPGYTNWLLGEPTKSNINENCVLFHDVTHLNGNMWNDLPCDVPQFAVCEYD